MAKEACARATTSSVVRGRVAPTSCRIGRPRGAAARLERGVTVLALGVASVAPILVASPASATPAAVVFVTSTFYAVACPTATTCEAVGVNYSTSQGIAVSIANGIPGTAQAIPGTVALRSVACPTATTCEAVGLTSTGSSVVVPITNGIAGTAQAVSGTIELQGVACPTATICEAVGNESSTQGVVVPITNGTPGAAQVIPGTILLGVACPTATTCEAVGEDLAGRGVVVPISNATAGSPQVASSGVLLGVACPTTTTCEAVGVTRIPPPLVALPLGAVVSIANGTPGATQAVPETEILFGIACATATTCEAVGQATPGSVTVSSPPAAVVPVTHGAVGAAQVISAAHALSGVACPSATTCVAVGNDLTQAVAVPFSALPTAALTYPTDGQLEVDTTRPFTWSTIPEAQRYYLIIGTHPFRADLVNSGVLPSTQSSLDVGALPAGATLFATLFTEVNGAWGFQASTFTAAPGEATFTFPLNGQTGVDPTRAFTWSTVPQAQGYILVVGATQYGSNLVFSGMLPPTQSTYPTPTLPAGKTLYAALFTKVNGRYSRVQSIKFTTGPAMGSFTRPINGQANVPTPTTFTWSTIAAAQNYYLVIGTTQYGTNLVHSGVLPPTQSSYQVPALPHGRTLYATLFTRINGTWVFQAISFGTP
ncbi:MAG: hypothetical protein M3256_17645 [Actinomycetota bacterium]|nr:hypothetical protein [Actinomycetota bacterium]